MASIVATPLSGTQVPSAFLFHHPQQVISTLWSLLLKLQPLPLHPFNPVGRGNGQMNCIPLPLRILLGLTRTVVPLNSH